MLQVSLHRKQHIKNFTIFIIIIITSFLILFQFLNKSQSRASTSTADDGSAEQRPSDDDIDEISDEDSDIEAVPPPTQVLTKNKYKSTARPDDITVLVDKLVHRADKAAEDIKTLMTSIPKTKHEMTVQQYCAYLATQLVEIRPELWFEFTMDTQRMVHNYVTRSKQTGQNLPQQQEVQQPQPSSDQVRSNTIYTLPDIASRHYARH